VEVLKLFKYIYHCYVKRRKDDLLFSKIRQKIVEKFHVSNFVPVFSDFSFFLQFDFQISSLILKFLCVVAKNMETTVTILPANEAERSVRHAYMQNFKRV
jgi:hypothetical protein